MRNLRLITLITLFILTALHPAFADTFSISVPAGTEVVMADPQATIPVTITNNGPTRNIRSVTFNIDPTKYSFSASTVPPSGWCVNSVSAAVMQFELTQAGGSCTNGSTASQLDPLESAVFNITVVPVAAASDSIDSFSSVSVSMQSGFTMSGALPTWTLRSLDAALTASPSSLGVNGTITLNMQVTNRSTATQSTLASVPEPPTPSSPIVTKTGGPFYASTILTSGLNSSSTSIGVSSTADFPSSGTLTIDSEEICYSGKTATAFTGATRGCNGTTAATHSSTSLVYGMDPFSIAPDGTKAVTWTYRADSTGTVYFSGRATDASGTARSKAVNSNTVTIGDFTASLVVSPESVINGQQVTVEMTVTNNGNSALVNISPSLLNGCAGGATETPASGPSPAFISSLSKESSGVFTWTYAMTGAVGQTYCLTGGATANGPVMTNTATSNSGRISAYSVTTAPSVVSSGATNQAITWNVYNGGGCSIRSVAIAIPNIDWACSSVTPPAGWQAGCDQTIVTFTSTQNQFELAPGSTTSFSIFFSSVETVTGDKVAAFPVTLTPRGCGGETNTIGSYITVSANSLALSRSPAGPVYADGSSYYTITATLTSGGGSPVAGKAVTFTATSGTLSAGTAVTDASGQATVRLVAPNSTVDTASTVTAGYLSAEGSVTLTFIAWVKPNVQYWGALAPVSVSCGSSYTFTMDLRNISSSSMSIGTGSYFSFNDSASGGTSSFKAFLDTPVTIAPGATRSVSFGSATSAGGGGGVVVSSAFLSGSFEPISNSSPPPASGLFLADGGTNDQYRAITDSVTTTGNCGSIKVRIIDWHEMR